MTAEVEERVGSEISPNLRDGYEVHRAALRHGMNVTLLPRQVMIVSPPDDRTKEVAFVHGVPSTSTLSAVTFAQDKRMRRARLVAAGLPVPKGGSFSISNGVGDAKRLINKIGYPVVIKPAMGDNMIEVHPGLEDEAQVDEAIDYLRTLPNERPTYTKAAYALTLLGEPEEVDGRVLVPRGYRFLVEEHVSGNYLRFLVIDGQVLSVVHCRRGADPTRAELNCDVTHEVHPSLTELAKRATSALAGLAVAAVDLVVDGIGTPVDKQNVTIVDLSERPWLAAQAAISDEMSKELGDALLTAHAATENLESGSTHNECAIELSIEGLTNAVGAISAMRSTMKEFDLDGRLDVTDPVEGVVYGSMQGTASAIAGLAELLLDGAVDGNRAMRIEERPSTPRVYVDD